MISRFKDPSRFSRQTKRLLMVAADAVFLPLALYSAFMLRFGELNPDVNHLWWLFVAMPTVSLPVFLRLGLYRAVVRFMGSQVVLAVAKGVTLSALLLAAMTVLTQAKGVPRSVYFIYWGVAALYIGGSRFVIRAYVQALRERAHVREPVIIYGAGSAGNQLALALAAGFEYRVVAFLDDNPSLGGSVMQGIPVYDSRELPEIVEKADVRQVLLAVPSLSRGQRRAILERLETLPVYVKTIPGMGELIAGSARVDDIREVEIEDLLGRDCVAPDDELLHACVRGKVVMVTGAGGSIGSELCRQIAALEPTRLVLFEQSEFALYRIEKELRAVVHDGVEILPLLGSVQDRGRLESVMRVFGVDTIYHAAAYKHVPLVEHNIVEGVRNNIFGTLETARAAINSGVGTFVLISTDKAVRPTNVMGASKRVAELVLQGLSQTGTRTRFCMVRFGNVLGSSGSVVPLFREQIRMGGPVTVTHPEITRYFMTIPEAAQLVLQAGSMGRGGDVFVLDMGKPVRIVDLAVKMVHLMGLSVRTEDDPEGDISIVFTGLRPGEKLYEELLVGANVTGTKHPRIMRAEERALSWDEVEQTLERLQRACEHMDCPAIGAVLAGAVEGFVVGQGRQDLVCLATGARQEAAKVVSLPGKR
jgi:FlaA1/EpsC-like NDP-sugar epimerase